MTLHHLAYLQQLSDLLEDKHKPLAAHYGYIAREIAYKHVVHSSGLDSPKLRHCRACQTPITSSDVKCDDGKLHIRCPLCGLSRNYRVIPKSTKNSKQQSNGGEDGGTS